MATYDLAVIGGDGIGPEVTAEAVKTVRAAAEVFGFAVSTTDYDLGGARYLRTGETLPSTVAAELGQHDAILLGAIGHPGVQPGLVERPIILGLRTMFDQYVNLRPIRLMAGAPTPIKGLTPEQCDLVVVRENMEGLYPGAGGLVYEGHAAEVAIQESVNTRFGVERILRDAFQRAASRRGRLTICHKTNVQAYAGSLWMRAARDLASEFPTVTLDYVNVDAMCLYLVTDPGRFDVVVTDSMFGDIISDLGGAITGGLGFSGSGNINPARTAPSMFEPIHGSAPDIAGKGIANPIAAILAAGMCLEFLGERGAAQGIESAVQHVVATVASSSGWSVPQPTASIGDAVATALHAV
jgi:3-isopropylmalate dehydrogenase